MTYLTTINIPVAFAATDDDEARAILARIVEHFAYEVSLGDLRDEHDVEVIDAPTAAGLEEDLPYEPLRAVAVDFTGPTCDDCGAYLRIRTFEDGTTDAVNLDGSQHDRHLEVTA